jgi:predicted phage terminase large subunit-like protein
MTTTAADPADVAVLGDFGRKLDEAPTDPRAVWRLTARPEQLLPPGDEWRVCYWQGGRGCIAPWTLIWLPLEHRHERVDVLAAAGLPVTVLALSADGPRLAVTDGAPFVKGVTDLYEVTTDDGHTVTVTAEHRFLTPDGWQRLCDLAPQAKIAAGPGAAAYVAVSAVRATGPGTFYDLTVPGPASYLAEGLWHHNSGKNMSCSNAMAEWLLSDTDGEGEYGVIGPTYADAWTKQIEGKSGLLRALGTNMGEIKDHRSATVRGAWRTYGQVLLHNGITVYVDSAAEGGLRVQGRNLKGAWCSEIGLWDRWDIAWKESVVYAVREGKSQIIVDGTPKASRKARKLIRSFIRNDPEHGGVIIRKLKTRDNVKNLSEAFVRAVIGGFRGTRLELQELEGELLDDVANALWTRDLLDSIHCPGYGQPGGPRTLLKTYIGVDPSDGSEDSDEQAYTVIGKGMPEDRHLYVVENWGGQESPPVFAKRVIRKAVEWNATVIVEKNHGGKWLKEVFAQAQKDMGTHVRVEMVHASDAKRARAEPVAVMYDRISEDGRPLVLHCHRTWTDDEDHLQVDEHMPELEDTMATFTGAAGEKSPDRLDSLVWGAYKFLRETFGPPGAPGKRDWAGARELAGIGGSDEQRAHQKIREIQERQASPDDEPWGLDGFGPQDDREAPRGNVRPWG